jgi:putative restriction endonuclease
VSNGLSLCKLHHAAFDSNLVSVRPDYVIEVRKDILRERDGPMLVHGLQGLHNGTIILPVNKKQHPDRDRLEIRYKQFKEAG